MWRSTAAQPEVRAAAALDQLLGQSRLEGVRRGFHLGLCLDLRVPGTRRAWLYGAGPMRLAAGGSTVGTMMVANRRSAIVGGWPGLRGMRECRFVVRCVVRREARRHVRSKVQTISPKKATEMLAANTANRPLSKPTAAVVRLLLAMTQ